MKFSKAKQLCKKQSTIIVYTTQSGQYVSDGIHAWRLPDGAEYTARGVGIAMDFDEDAMANNEILVRNMENIDSIFNAERTEADIPLTYQLTIQYNGEELEIWKEHDGERAYIIPAQAMRVMDNVAGFRACARRGSIAIFSGMVLEGVILPNKRESTQDILTQLKEIGNLAPGGES